MDFITILTVAQYAAVTVCSILGATWTFVKLRGVVKSRRRK